jgi:hypothetical protein
MNRIKRISPYLARGVLLFACALFTDLGVRSVFFPAYAAARNQMVLQAPFAVTAQQVGFGAFPLAAAILLLISLIRRETLVAGLTMVAVFVLTALLVRLYAISAHGIAPQDMRPLVAESILSLVSFSALYLEKQSTRLNAR